MIYTFRPKGVCPSQIQFDVTDGVVSDIRFTGGCNGNLKAISKLLDGMPVSEVVEKLQGNTCGNKATSCSDQLATALSQV